VNPFAQDDSFQEELKDSFQEELNDSF